MRTLNSERDDDAVGGRQDSVMIRCNDSLETWYLTCTSNHWLGQLANCTHSTYILASRDHMSRDHVKPADEIVLFSAKNKEQKQSTTRGR